MTPNGPPTDAGLRDAVMQIADELIEVAREVHYRDKGASLARLSALVNSLRQPSPGGDASLPTFAEAYGCAPNAKHIDEPHEPIPDRAFVRVGETEWEYNATYEFWRNVLRKGSNAYSEHAEAISVLYHAQRENAQLREENERLRRSR